jgi:hypothetical protein
MDQSGRPVPSFGEAIVMLSKRLADVLRGSGPGAIERLSEALMHLLIDWELPGEVSDAEPLPEHLPPLDAQEFVEALRDRVEQTLRGMAAAINAAPGGAIVDASEERIAELLGELWADALALGVQMRLDAADGVAPTSRWASKYRAMRAAGEVLPDVSFRPKQD